jgi:hypothetical protein
MKNSNDAMALAIRAMGSGRTDKGGVPYVIHLAETLVIARNYAGMIDVEYDDELRQAAILHDTVEDSEVTLDDLRTAGYSERVISLVDALTHRPGEPKVDYWKRVVAAGPAARAIKAADAASNSNPWRLGPASASSMRFTAKRKVYIALQAFMLGPDASSLHVLRTAQGRVEMLDSPPDDGA